MRPLALLLLATAAHAAVIRYYLHGATIGDGDDRHASFATVTGTFDFDSATGQFLTSGISFAEVSYGGQFGRSSPEAIYTNATAAGSAWRMESALLGIYINTYAVLDFASVLGQPRVDLDATRSYVRFYECVAAPWGCADPILADDIYFNSGHLSSLQFEAGASNPEPSTWLLSAPCGCLAAWQRRRMRRRRS